MRASDVDHTLKALREGGYKVSVRHTRRYITGGGMEYHLGNRERLMMKQDGVTYTPHEFGGMTRVSVRDTDGTEYEGIAVCSKRDQFVQRNGTAIALGRCVKALHAVGWRV